MKNKTLTYGLIGVAMLIWGWIFLTIFSSFFSSEKNVVNTLKKPAVVSNKIYQEPISFTLVANYRDPFLGKVFEEPEFPKITARPPVKVKEPQIPVDWSFVKYLGMIKNPNSDKKIALISIKGQEHMISEGQIIADVKCIKNYKDSIRISYQGRSTCIKR
jgi:hypothetical protein